jgi:hypothetical protein
MGTPFDSEVTVQKSRTFLKTPNFMTHNRYHVYVKVRNSARRIFRVAQSKRNYYKEIRKL